MIESEGAKQYLLVFMHIYNPDDLVLSFIGAAILTVGVCWHSQGLHALIFRQAALQSCAFTLAHLITARIFTGLGNGRQILV